MSLATDNRIAGYDLARAISLFGMMLINYWLLFEDCSSEPEWLEFFLGTIQGRAAALFVVLAGVGISLLSRQAYLKNDASALRTIRRNMMRRSLFLFLIGLLNCILWPPDILHFYGAYFFIGAFLLTVSNLRLGVLALLMITTFAILSFMAGFDRSWDWNFNTPKDLLNAPAILSHLLFSGQYPVFPWLAFLITGMWLGRQNLNSHSFRRGCLLAGLGVFDLAETVSWMGFCISDKGLFGFDIEHVLPWIDMDPWEPMPLFVLSAIGSSMCVIVVSVKVAEKFKNSKWLFAFSALGQLTLTIYVAHILLGWLLVLAMISFGWHTHLFTLWGSVVIYLGSMLFAYQWRNSHEKGPLEWVLRWFSLYSIKPKRAVPLRV